MSKKLPEITCCVICSHKYGLYNEWIDARGLIGNKDLCYFCKHKARSNVQIILPAIFDMLEEQELNVIGI